MDHGFEHGVTPDMDLFLSRSVILYKRLRKHGKHVEQVRHALTFDVGCRTAEKFRMRASVILTEPYAGLQAQALGLAEAAGLEPELVSLMPRAPWKFVSARMWPAPLQAVTLPVIRDAVVFSAGGTAAVVAAALRRPGRALVQVQHPRIDPSRFDVIVVNRHDGLNGPNVIVTRTALHRANSARLVQAREVWGPRLAHLPRPLVSVLVGGSNGRFRLDAAVSAALGAQLAQMVRLDGVGIALTPSRRTAPEAVLALRAALEPVGGWVWDRAGENPYFGLLACADGIVVTEDSVSMVSEACATAAPVFLAALPGHSRRIRQFSQYLIEDGRVRAYTGRFELWPVHPLDDTQAAADEMNARIAC